MSPRIEALRGQIQQLDTLVASGALTADEAASAKTRLERELLDLVLKEGASSAGAAPAAAGKAGTAQAAAVAPPAESAAPRPSRRLVAGIAAFVLVFGAAGYAWLGNPEGWSTSPGQPPAQAEAGGGNAPHTMDSSQFEAMAAKLAERLKDKPDDAEGWTMLGRSYAVLKRFPEAATAFRKAIELHPKDAQAHADLADAVAMVNGRTLDGEPTRLIEQALKLDPDNLKALSLAGTVAFQKADYALAVRHWERAVKVGEPGSDMVRSVQGAIEEARQRGGLGPAATAPAGKEPAAKPEASLAAATGAQVSGRVTLAAALKDKASPQDTVFVFARAAEGRMPLAILRKQVKDLPLEFVLDDSMAMSPAARLSGAASVVIGARISKSGNAMPQPGDLQGLSAPVKPGASGLAIEIAEAVK